MKRGKNSHGREPMRVLKFISENDITELTLDNLDKISSVLSFQEYLLFHLIPRGNAY